VARKQEPERSFEELYADLEDRARRLEEGNLPLEESLKLYEEAATIADRLRVVLEGAELRVRTIQRRFERDESTLQELEAAYDAGEEGQ